MSDSTSPNGNKDETGNPGTIAYAPVAGQRDAAAERRRSFPYRFPRDGRLLGGKFSVAENALRLLRFFYFERRLMQALGAWTLSIPEFEVKLEHWHPIALEKQGRSPDGWGMEGWKMEGGRVELVRS